MKTPINPWNVFFYIVAPATALGFVASAVPALAGAADLATTFGLAGVGVGAVLGLAVGLIRRFR
jgi:hypothetical protein